MTNPDPKLTQQWVTLMFHQLITPQPPPPQQLVIRQPLKSPVISSSIGSTTHMERFLVDDIIRPISCSLFIAYSITNVRMLEVATGLTILIAHFIVSPFLISTLWYKCKLAVMRGHQNNLLATSTSEGS